MPTSTADESSPELLFYDGDCGVCHWAVRFVATRDRDGRCFRFAPLGGPTFAEQVGEKERARLGDTLLVLTRDGEVLHRSTGMIHILRRLGGFWRLLGSLSAIVPRPLRDWAYDRFAAVRHRLVRRPEGACPLLPPELRGRFEP